MVLPKHHISLNARNKKQALFWLALVENSINPPILHTTKNLSYIPIFDNVLIFKKQSKILPINFINYFIEQKNPILRIKEKDVYSLISQETFNIQVINLDEIKITFDKSSIDYYNLLIVLKNMCNLEFTTNDFLFQLIYEEFVNENKLNDLWKCYKVNLLEWQKLSFETN